MESFNQVPRESSCVCRPSYNEKFGFPLIQFNTFCSVCELHIFVEAIMDDVVIVSAVRTPIGKFQGSLSDLSAPQLGALVVKEAVGRAHLEPKQVDECIM